MNFGNEKWKHWKGEIGCIRCSRTQKQMNKRSFHRYMLMHDRPPDERHVRVMFWSLVQDLQRWHQQGRYHLDIRINTILHGPNQWVLSLEPSRFEQHSTVCSSASIPCPPHAYMPPELILRVPQVDCESCDVYSLGICLFAMSTLRMPYKLANWTDSRYRLVQKEGLKALVKLENIPISDGLVHLLSQMLCEDPRKRLTLDGVARHFWLFGGGW